MATKGFIEVAPSAAVLAVAKKNAAPGQTAEQYLASRGGVNAEGYYGKGYDPVKAAETAANKALGKTDYSVALAKGEITPSGSKVPTGPTTSTDVLKSLLVSMGFSRDMVDSSTSFFSSLIKEGLDYDNIVTLFTDSKDYTLKNGSKIISPFYQQYGYLNDGLTQPKSASELFHFVEGTKNLIKSYGISSKFAEPDSLKKYIANNVTIEKLDERIMAAKVKTISADPQYVNTLRQLKYINGSEDLTDFFLDPKIGEAQLEINRKTAAFSTEAMRRAGEKTGISFNADSLTKTAATLIGQGRSEAQIADISRQGYETISDILNPEVGLSNIFEGKNAASAATIQSELEAEQFMGTASERRKRLAEQGTRLMQGSAGVFSGRSIAYSNQSTAGQL